MSRPALPLEFRVVEKVELSSDGCWLWTGKVARDGYGRLQVGGRKGQYRLAHRVAYELAHGSIPEGLTLDHLCRVRRCVNPAHLEPVSVKVNVLRGVSPFAVKAAATHCVNGHEFTEQNTYIRANGARACRRCAAIRARKYRAVAREMSV